jgi:hypothetical protein
MPYIGQKARKAPIVEYHTLLLYNISLASTKKVVTVLPITDDIEHLIYINVDGGVKEPALHLSFAPHCEIELNQLELLSSLH